MSTSPNTLESILGPNPEQLLEELEQFFPPVNPTPDTSLGQIMYRAGQRSVVNYLIQRKEEES